MTSWGNIRREYETTKITLKALAEKHDIKIGTLKSRKSREKWLRDLTEKDATKTKKVAPPKKVAPQKKVGGQPGNRGNPHPKNQFTKRNKSAVTHGLFSKYLPEETLNIVNEIDSITPLDILWMNIKMQFASIMRAQQIMFVRDQTDLTKELKKSKYEVIAMGEEIKQVPIEEEYELQFAWDKQASFLNSQSRAMGELRSMLKQFIEMADYEDDRLLEVEKMRAAIDKTKAETEKIATNEDTGPIEIMIKRKGDG
ncbi:hypothetical protein GLW20_01550 [Virgibacillus halodenitrificans]|nr:hypothetical protein [Virgibacillus halodenitrificans]